MSFLRNFSWKDRHISGKKSLESQKNNPLTLDSEKCSRSLELDALLGRFLFWLYRALVILATPFGWLWIRIRVARGKEDPARLAERFGFPSLLRPAGSLVWIHGASVGEVMGALGLVEMFLTAYPSFSVLLTTGTLTSARLLKKRFDQEPRVLHQMVPVDWPWCVSRFLDFWKPTAMLLLEGDFWPHLLTYASRRGISRFLINAQLSDRSFERWRRLRPFLRFCLHDVKGCLTVSPEQEKKFHFFGVPQILVTGSLKWTAPFLPADRDLLKKYQKAFGGRPLWLAASTHSGEEEILLEAHQALQKLIPGLLLIMVPRHPMRVGEVGHLLRRRGFSFACSSSFKDQQDGGEDIFLVDEMGLLGLFYRLAKVAFVGGSLIPAVGGHNILEPACLGSTVLHGPFMEKQQDIVSLFHERGACLQVEKASDLVLQVARLLGSPLQQKAFAEQAISLVIDQREKILKMYGKALSPFIPVSGDV